MSHGLFYQCPCYVSGNISVALMSMKGQSSSTIFLFNAMSAS